jgi:hypothetical protein
MWSSIPGDRFAVAGIVADPVTAIRVGEIPAAVQSNAFTATIPFGASDVITLTSPGGERQLRRPSLGL